jgi:hypothetical protein
MPPFTRPAPQPNREGYQTLLWSTRVFQAWRIALALAGTILLLALAAGWR